MGTCSVEGGYETVYGGKVHLPNRMGRLEDSGYRNLTSDARGGLADACADFIKGPHVKPFFLFASFINPHDICYMAINDYRVRQGGKRIDNLDSRVCEQVLDEARQSGDIAEFVAKHAPPLPDNHGIPACEPECITRKYTQERPFREYVRRNWGETEWRLHRWAYCRLTEMVDEQIGVVLDALSAAGLENNTLVVFTSDHGEHDSAHKLEHKSILYEEAANIPFIMSYEGVIRSGAVDREHLVSNGLDLLPTLCDYAGIPCPSGLHGRSLRPLAEKGRARSWRDHLVVESQNGRLLHTGRYKYCRYDSGANPEQLTDLTSDPGETRNLAPDRTYRETLAKHRRLLGKWVERTGDRIAAEYV